MLETNRCVLSLIHKDDYEDVKKLYLDERVREYLGGTVTEERVKGSFTSIIEADDGSLYFVAREKATKQFIGTVSLDTHHDGVSTEVSYQLLPEWWGAGYATEVVKEVIQYGFTELQLPELVAETQAANEASCRLLERLGMTVKENVQRFGAEQVIYVVRK
ncbi:N-acetyltransferase [Anaerobacillus alkaliphilus]|uniref:N-acetyltransferase n=1 Tax=Anaerobacillus alkaliphilus TaxID=1548597 RepID=A0A4Q0VYD2_9BACI|nr:GNAT family N-acetyltransferase [Anaerobacillus alkaliphilus]RXJ04422.1 N-acetyltransferase [Anaerobacillus alkaliphilus]